MGDNNRYAAVIKSSKFNNLSKIEQHKLVYRSLKGKMGNELHALSITRKVMETNKKRKSHKNNDVCLFMKGTPDSPQCGFSMTVSNVLKHLNVNLKVLMF